MATEEKLILNPGEYCIRFRGLYDNSNTNQESKDPDNSNVDVSQWTSWKYCNKKYPNIKKARADFSDLKNVDNDFKLMKNNCRQIFIELLDAKDNALCSVCIGKDH